MALCTRRRIKFIHIPKTGGTAVIQALGLDPQGYHDAWSVYPPETASFIRFAVVRDPIQRFISQYNFGMSDRSFWHIKGTKHEFGDFQAMKDMSLHDIIDDLQLPWQQRRLKHSGWWPQSWFVCDRQGRARVHYLIRQENLEAELNAMLSELGISPVSLPQVNVSERRLSLETLTTDRSLMERILQLYRADYATFGYPIPVLTG